MQIVILKNSAEVAEYGANIFKKQLQSKPDSVLGLATGSTPVSLYQGLIEANKLGDISFKEVTSFNLDEYLGLAGTHPQSYRYFMNEQLFDHIDIDKANTHVPLEMLKTQSKLVMAMKSRSKLLVVSIFNCLV